MIIRLFVFLHIWFCDALSKFSYTLQIDGDLLMIQMVDNVREFVLLPSPDYSPAGSIYKVNQFHFTLKLN